MPAEAAFGLNILTHPTQHAEASRVICHITWGVCMLVKVVGLTILIDAHSARSKDGVFLANALFF